MHITTVMLALIVSGQPPSEGIEAEHQANFVYQSLRTDGLKVAGAHVSFPAPMHVDGMSADLEREALNKLAGSKSRAAELTRDSVSAPMILKVRDEGAGNAGAIRVADLRFLVHARLGDIDPARAEGELSEGRSVEAGNMKFTSARLDEQALAARGIKAREGSEPPLTWYVHMTGHLLDRIAVEATDRVTATRSSGSWVIAARTDPKFDGDREFPNRWRRLARSGASEETKPAERFSGGASYVKISELKSVPGALLVEAHFAFFEPRAWFDGAPILRSKIGVVAQDRIRSLRRELQKKSHRDEPHRSSSGLSER
jgi:hypothetical protein